MRRIGIRYSDAFTGVRDIPERLEMRAPCTDSRFVVIARAHRVGLREVFESRERREMWRLHDGHISYRATRLPWRPHALDLFGAGVVAFWLIAWRRWRTDPADPRAG